MRLAVPGLLGRVPRQDPLALGQEVPVAEVEELLDRRRRWVGHAVAVQELVAGPTAGDLVRHVLNPLWRVAEALAGAGRDDVVDREREPDLVTGLQRAAAVDAREAALLEDSTAVAAPAGTVSPRRAPRSWRPPPV